MKNIALVVVCWLIQFPLRAQNTLPAKIIVYLVRHGEKAPGTNPPLSSAGQQRAKALMNILKKKNIKRIYVTEYIRTQMTADSMRLQLHIDTVQYAADTTGNDLMEKIKARNDFGKSILVIGHSNTIPRIINALGVIKRQPDIPDDEFDNLYMVKITKGKATLAKKKYGLKTP